MKVCLFSFVLDRTNAFRKARRLDSFHAQTAWTCKRKAFSGNDEAKPLLLVGYRYVPLLSWKLIVVGVQVKEVVKRCQDCLSYAPPQAYSVPLQPIVKQYPMELLTMDLKKVHLFCETDIKVCTSSPFPWLLVFRCATTRKCWFYPLRRKMADSVAEKLRDLLLKPDVKRVLSELKEAGIDAICLSDNGGEFVGEVVETTLAEFGLGHVRTRPYTPSQNGGHERVNKTIGPILKALVDKYGAEWHLHYDEIDSGYNGLFECI